MGLILHHLEPMLKSQSQSQMVKGQSQSQSQGQHMVNLNPSPSYVHMIQASLGRNSKPLMDLNSAIDMYISNPPWIRIVDYSNPIHM